MNSAIFRAAPAPAGKTTHECYHAFMDINLMTISVGNSRVAIGVFIAGTLEHVTRLSLTQRDDWAGRIADAWGRIANMEQPAIAGASVNPPVLESLEHVIHQATGQSVQWIGREIDLPVPVRTESPRETGIDRILNIAAAYEQMGKACVVVDAGTAITVDCCNDKGEFLGGAIAPGLSMMLDSLHEKTAKLPRVTFEKPVPSFGASTTDAIRLGTFHAIRGLVRDVVESFAEQLGNWPDIIVTGGDARALFEGWELIHAVAPDLMLYGIALAYTNHQIKHES